jgi:hypothetical protein
VGWFLGLDISLIRFSWAVVGFSALIINTDTKSQNFFGQDGDKCACLGEPLCPYSQLSKQHHVLAQHRNTGFHPPSPSSKINACCVPKFNQYVVINTALLLDLTAPRSLDCPADVSWVLFGRKGAQVRAQGNPNVNEAGT